MKNRAAPALYLALAEEGPPEEQDRVSRPRKTFLALCAVLVLAAMPLFWANAAEAGDSGPQALAASSGPGKGGDDDDDSSGPGGNSGPGGGHDDTDHDDDTTTRNTANSVSDTTTGAKTHGDDTRGTTGEGRDRMTGRETHGEKTDFGDTDTGVSTRGETDRGDKTGKTERH